jgi:hypothetical protein
LNYTLVTLTPKHPEFAFWLTLAHRWTQDRPRFYVHTGGFSLLLAYLDEARRPDKKQIGVFRDGEMLSLVTVEFEGDGSYCFHVTSPKRADTATIRHAVRAVVDRVFDGLSAEYLYMTAPTFNGHEHKGSRALAEHCGARPEGLPEEEAIGGMTYLWQRYSLKRDTWLYGRQKNHIHN